MDARRIWGVWTTEACGVIPLWTMEAFKVWTLDAIPRHSCGQRMRIAGFLCTLDALRPMESFTTHWQSGTI